MHILSDFLRSDFVKLTLITLGSRSVYRNSFVIAFKSKEGEITAEERHSLNSFHVINIHIPYFSITAQSWILLTQFSMIMFLFLLTLLLYTSLLCTPFKDSLVLIKSNPLQFSDPKYGERKTDH